MTGISRPVTGNIILQQENSSSGRRLLTGIGNKSLCDRKFLPGTEKFFLWHEVPCRKVLSRAGSFCNISSFWYKSWQKCVIFVISEDHNKSAWFFFKTLPESSGFLARFLPPYPLKSHLPISHIPYPLSLTAYLLFMVISSKSITKLSVCLWVCEFSFYGTMIAYQF